MHKNDFNSGLLAFLDSSPTPFHAVASMSATLESAGFQAIEAGQEWQLQDRGRYYLCHNGSSIIAFSGFAADAVTRGVRLFGAHTDSPCLKLKPAPVTVRHGCLQVGVEVYGGALLNPWFDRDLSIAGRVTVIDANQQIQSLLVDWQKPLAVIPSLAIHLDRDANSSRSVNPQNHLPAILQLNSDDPKTTFAQLLREQLQRQYDIAVERILDFELSLYDCQPAAIIGAGDELIASARLDNLLSCYAGLQAICQADASNPALLVCNDHEEVGSVSATGADGPLLTSVLQRLVGNAEGQLTQCLSRSLMISADNAHAVHPNYADKHDDNHGPQINKGPVIKVNVNQRYATNSITSAFYKQLSENTGEPFQVFVVRSDMACGSTIGPITAAKLGVKTVDVGAPQWAMHSIRETCGIHDAYSLFRVAQSFMNTDSLPAG